MNEHKMCKEIINWARLSERRYPFLRWLFHISNEGKRNPWKAKEIGIIAGPSDYFLPVPTTQYHGLWLEVKTTGKKPTEAQLRWLKEMKDLGFFCYWSDRLDKIIQTLDWYCKQVRWEMK